MSIHDVITASLLFNRISLAIQRSSAQAHSTHCSIREPVFNAFAFITCCVTRLRGARATYYDRLTQELCRQTGLRALAQRAKKQEGKRRRERINRVNRKCASKWNPATSTAWAEALAGMVRVDGRRLQQLSNMKDVFRIGSGNGSSFDRTAFVQAFNLHSGIPSFRRLVRTAPTIRSTGASALIFLKPGIAWMPGRSCNLAARHVSCSAQSSFYRQLLSPTILRSGPY